MAEDPGKQPQIPGEKSGAARTPAAGATGQDPGNQPQTQGEKSGTDRTPAAGASAENPRDLLWQMTWETYYRSYFEEIAADLLIDRWQLVDDAAKILVTLTATGSAFSGLAFWTDPFFRPIWAALAFFGALLAGAHTSLGVPGRIKDWSEIKRRFASLRIDLETFFNGMQLNPDLPMAELSQRYAEFRRVYNESTQLLKNDSLRTSGLLNRAQDRLDESVKDKIA